METSACIHFCTQGCSHYAKRHTEILFKFDMSCSILQTAENRQKSTVTVHSKFHIYNGLDLRIEF